MMETLSSTSATGDPAPSNDSHQTSSSKIQPALDRLLDNLKITKATDCPKHKDVALCSCPAALRRIIDDTIPLKLNHFVFIWEMHTLLREHAWEFDGTQQSHHAFTALHGDTPKHFAREFIQCQEVLAPARKQAELVQAMLEVWILRNKEWRERYGSREKTRKEWSKNAYPGLPVRRSQIPMTGYDTDLERAFKANKLGTVFMFWDRTIGPPWHRCTTTLCYHGRYEKRDGSAGEVVRVHAIEICHEECEFGRKMVADFLDKAVHDFCVSLGKKPEEAVIMLPQEGLESIEVKSLEDVEMEK